MAVTQTYVGQSVDLCVLETSALVGAAPVFVGFEGSGSVTAGPYKIVQKFVKRLMTAKGSVPSDVTYGTTFISKLLGGHIHTAIGLSMEFYQDMPALLNFIDRANLTPPDSENLVGVSLEGLAVTLDSATMRLVFTFKDSSVILAPVSISTV